MEQPTLLSIIIISLLAYLVLLQSKADKPYYSYSRYSRELPRMDYDRPIDNIIDYPRYIYDQAPMYGSTTFFQGKIPMQFYPVQYSYDRNWRRRGNERRDERGRRWRRPRFAQDTLAKTESKRSTSPEKPNQLQISSDTSGESKSANN